MIVFKPITCRIDDFHRGIPPKTEDAIWKKKKKKTRMYADKEF